MLAATSDEVFFCFDELMGSATLRDGSWSVTRHRPMEIEQLKIMACCLSTSGQLLVLETDDKSVILFTRNTNTWKCIGSCRIPRRSSSLLFTPDQNAVIFGDKSGNVFKLSVTCFEKHFECESSTPLLGHLSMLSDVAISDCGTLIATSDRDEKIRVSLFDQPCIIESFCLGHAAFVTQLSFIPNSEFLLSAGGDSYLRCWQSRTGRQLGAFRLEFPTISGLSLEANTRSSDCPVIVSRLTVIAPNICVGACASHPVIFCVPVHIASEGAIAEWGQISINATPADRPLLDCVVCPLSASTGAQPRSCVAGLTDESPSRLVLWEMFSSSKLELVCQFGNMKEIYVFPEEIQSRLPVPSPRIELIKSLFKSSTDRSMLDAYEEMKPIRHKNVLDRRVRHQRVRQKNKKLKQSISV